MRRGMAALLAALCLMLFTAGALCENAQDTKEENAQEIPEFYGYIGKRMIGDVLQGLNLDHFRMCIEVIAYDRKRPIIGRFAHIVARPVLKLKDNCILSFGCLTVMG